MQAETNSEPYSDIPTCGSVFNVIHLLRIEKSIKTKLINAIYVHIKHSLTGSACSAQAWLSVIELGVTGFSLVSVNRRCYETGIYKNCLMWTTYCQHSRVFIFDKAQLQGTCRLRAGLCALVCVCTHVSLWICVRACASKRAHARVCVCVGVEFGFMEYRNIFQPRRGLKLGTLLLQPRERREAKAGNYQSRQQIGAFKKIHSYKDLWLHCSASD